MIITPPNQYYGKILTAVATGHARLHFSQLGEDGVIWHLYENVKNGFYVDVGCHHPLRFSNTALLAMFNGWRGINIDADERAIAAFRQYRPDDINIHCAVGEKAGPAELFLFKGGAVNTFDPTWAARQAEIYGVPEKHVVDMMPLRELLDRHMPDGVAIDLLNIDVEGLDLQVLRSNDWRRFRPRMICVETHNLDINAPQGHPTFNYMQSVGYRLTAHLLATSIYVPVPGWQRPARLGPTAAASDCVTAARESDDPSLSLLYYSAAEAAGGDDPSLCRQRDAILQHLNETELRFLNARCGSWRDNSTLDQTQVELQQVQYDPADFPDTVTGAEAAALMQGKEYERALQMCKFLVQRQREVPYACFMAGCCEAQTVGNEPQALTWLNMAKRFNAGAIYWINLNRAALLRRVGLPSLALDQMQQVARDGLADDRSLAMHYETLEELLGLALRPSDKDAALQALRSFYDAKRAYLENLARRSGFA